MSTATDEHRNEGVEFTSEDDFVTARDVETGVAAPGGSKAKALAMLGEALALHEGGGRPIDDEEQFLRDIGIDSAEIEEDGSPPPWLA